MYLKWRNDIFDNSFMRLIYIYILCDPFLSLIAFFGNNLGYEHTPH
jgi:hypothetical protein